jgi:hypothetical protein
MAVSREMMHLLYGRRIGKYRKGRGQRREKGEETNLVQRNLKQHIPRPLHPKELSRNEDQVLLCQQTHVLLTQDAGKRRGEVDVRGGFFLNRLNDATFPTGDDVVEFVVDLAYFGVQTGLCREERRRRISFRALLEARKDEGSKGRERGAPIHPTTPITSP